MVLVGKLSLQPHTQLITLLWLAVVVVELLIHQIMPMGVAVLVGI
jgi:hypothetical protein